MNVKTLLVIIALTAVGSACGAVESKPEHARATTPTEAKPAIPERSLRRTLVESPGLLDDYSPGGLQIFPGSRGRVLASNGEVILKGTP